MKPLRVLLVVNDEKVVRLLKRILHAQGHIYNVANWWYGEEGDSHFQKALNYLHDSGGRVNVVIADFFPKGADPTKLCIAPIVVKCRQLEPSPKVFALIGNLSAENALYWKKEFQLNGVLPNPDKDPDSFEVALKEMITHSFGEEREDEGPGGS